MTRAQIGGRSLCFDIRLGFALIILFKTVLSFDVSLIQRYKRQLIPTVVSRPFLPQAVRSRRLSRKSSYTQLASDVASPDSTIPTAGVGVPKQMRKKKLQTFPRYLEVECWKRKDLRGLEPVLLAAANACKQINRIVQRAQTDDVYGVALDANGNPLSDNVQGEVQQKLDVLCNTIMLKAFCGSGREICSVASEEEDEPRCCAEVMVCSSVHRKVRSI